MTIPALSLSALGFAIADRRKLNPQVRLWNGVRRSILGLLCLISLIALLPQTALAHPMGNFSVNRYSRLEVADDQVGLLYIIDMAEIPTHAERALMDSDGDGAISPQEQQRYLDQIAATLSAKLQLTLDGQAATLQPVSRELAFLVGQADLPTLRIELRYTVTLAAGQQLYSLDYADNNYAERLGWREVIVAPQAGVEVVEANVPQQDISNELRTYPVDLLQNPPTIQSAAIRWQIAPTAQAAANSSVANVPAGVADVASRAGWSGDRFAQLVSIPQLGPWAVLLALLASFGWGAVHSLAPGHGKTIVAAYLVGTRGTIGHAFFLGATTTITHTIGVFALGLATFAASQWILPERIYPWLSTISGILLVTIGLSIGWSRLRALWQGKSVLGHDHNQENDEGGALHSHGWGQPHSHLSPNINERSDSNPVTRRSLLAVGISGGLLPCPSALVVLLGAIALGRVGFGLLLITVFSLGLASVLTAIGIVLIYASKLFGRIPEGGRYTGYLAVASAAVITLVGVGITITALIEAGLLTV